MTLLERAYEFLAESQRTGSKRRRHGPDKRKGEEYPWGENPDMPELRRMRRRDRRFRKTEQYKTARMLGINPYTVRRRRARLEKLGLKP